MGTMYLDPSANVNTLWTANAESLIDDAIRSPNIPGADMIQATGVDDNEGQRYTMTDTTLPAGYRVITAKLWVYGQIALSAGTPYGDINWAGCNEKSFGMGITLTWYSVEWTDLNFTSQVDVDLLQIYLNSKAIPDKGLINIHAAYIELTTELMWSGPSNFTKWNGLLIQSEVSKWNGLEWDGDLSKWNGID